MNSRPIIVESGAEIRPAFEAARAAVASYQPRPGHNSYLSLTPFGYSVSGRRQRGGFKHPWQPTLRGGKEPAISLSKGLVNGYLPVIRKGNERIPMVGPDQRNAPALPLRAEDIDSDRMESWVCVEVTSDDGELTDESLIEIVHRAKPYSLEPEIGRHPLVHLIWSDNRPGAAYEVTYFNLRYIRAQHGDDRPRHYFL